MLIVGQVVGAFIGHCGKFGGSIACHFLEDTVEGPDVVKTAVERDVGDLIVGGPEKIRGFFHTDHIQIDDKINAGQLLEYFREMALSLIHILNYNTVKDYFNSRFYWDANENVLLYTTPTDIIKAEVGSRDYYVSKNKNTESYAIVKVDGDQAFIALDYVQKFTNIGYETFQEPNRVHITYQWGEVQVADVKGDTQVRVKAGNKSPILTDVLKGDKLFVLPEEAQIEEWTKVRTGDGYIGYVLNKKIGETRAETTSREFEEPVYTNISKDYPINLVWHQVTNAQANGKLLELITNTKGVNTISPTWFSLSDNEGNISSLADKNYVTQCHQIGVEVWGLVDNFNKEVSTFEVLSHTSRRCV